MKDKIILTADIKRALLQALSKGYISRKDLETLFPSLFAEQPLFCDITKEECKQINDYLEDYC